MAHRRAPVAGAGLHRTTGGFPTPGTGPHRTVERITMKRTTPIRRGWAAVAVIAASSLALAACGSSDDPEPTTSPTSPGSTETEAPSEPEEKGSLTLAFSTAAPQVEKIPTILAAEAMEEAGYDVELIWLQSSEDPVQAVVRGDADLGSANVSTVFGAAAQGAPIKALMTQNMPSYAMVTPVEATSPEDLHGLRLGIHAPVSATALYGNLLLEDYPDVEPNTLVVPGSANRIQAMIAGELDASVIQLGDLDVLETEAPGQFHVMYNFATEMDDVIDSVMFATTSYLEENGDVVEEFLRALLDAQQLVKDDPSVLIDAIVRHVPEATQERAEEIAEVYLATNVWPEDGNFSDEVIARTVEAIKAYGGLETEPSTDCCTTEPLQAALAR